MYFKDLPTYAKFIVKPSADENDKGNAYYLFMKVAINKAARLFDGLESSIPDEMKILRVKGG